MTIKRYADDELAKEIRAAIRASDGHCPCVLAHLRSADTKCMCKEFREQIADPEFEGYCHCLLYYKSK